ncbi:MAG: diacylglycerol/polyprenol kinase family protein [bacterium]
MSFNNEDKRQLVHLAMGGFALLLRWLTQWQAMLFAAAALCFNLFILRRLIPALFRDQELKQGYSIGIIMYPLVVLILVTALPIYLAAGAWAILAVGDSFSNLIGRRFGTRKLYWNQSKSYAGLIGFILTSIIGCGFLLWWVKPDIQAYTLVNLSILGSVICGILETLPVKIDDNILVGLGAGVTLFLLSLIY